MNQYTQRLNGILRSITPCGLDGGPKMCGDCSDSVVSAQAAINQLFKDEVIGDIPPESERWRYNNDAAGHIRLQVKQMQIIDGGK